MLFPVDELTPEFIMQVKDTVKRRLVQKAMKQHTGTTPTDWVCREVVFGDSNTTDIYDIEPKTTWSSGIPAWVFDAADLTGDDFSPVTKAGEVVDDDKYIGFFGCADLAVEGGELTGAADTPVPIGAIAGVQFKRGASVLDQWGTEHLYAYQNVVGITDRPVYFDQTEKLQISVLPTEATEDKSFMLRGYICERVGDTISPDIDRRNPFAGGLHPVQELTKAMMADIVGKVEARLFQLIVEDGLVKTMAQAQDEYVIREVLLGDSANATDYIDLDNATAQVSGQENWSFDSADMTAGDLKNVLGTGINNGKVRDRAYIGIYGMWDRSANPTLIGCDFSDGSGRKDFWQPEHCYAYRDGAITAFTDRPIYFKQNTPIKFGINVKAAKDTWVGLRALIAEPWGTVISER